MTIRINVSKLGIVNHIRNIYHTVMDWVQALRGEVSRLLSGRGAHADFAAAVAEFPAELRGVKPHGSPHSAWQLLEHLRIAQWDMLEFSRNPAHSSPEWPGGYWPRTAEPSHPEAWDESVASFERDLAAMRELIASPQSDLFTPFSHGEGQTLLREALQLADHNAYHVGQLVSLRRLLRAWG